MGKRGRGKAPKPIQLGTVKSLKHSRKVVSNHHKLTAELHAQKERGNAEAAAELQQKLEQNGGIRSYQEASALSTNAHSTSKWVVKTLRKRGLTHPPSAKLPKPRVLEVGAINTQLLDCTSVDVRALDIHSMHPGRIEELDFMDMELPEQPYDAVVLSMVLNCVPNAEGRAAMLRKLRQVLRDEGLCFFVLPLSCLQHSHTLDEPAFVECLAAVGLHVLEDEQRTTPKLWFAVLQAGDPDPAALKQFRQHRKKPSGKAKAKRKSIGASFDVKL